MVSPTEEASGSPGGLRGIFGGGRSPAEKKPKTAHRRPAKIEPKSFMANERTFIQWVSSAMMCMTIASYLLLFSDGQGTLRVGMVLILVGLIILSYAIFTFFRRLKLLQDRSPSGYIDHFMPCVLTGAILISCLMLLAHYGSIQVQQNREPVPTYDATAVLYNSPPEGCNQHPTVGVNSISYRPSGIYDDQAMQALLVPSLDKVTALSWSVPDAPVQTLVTIPGSQLEGITFAGDDNRIFTVSDGPAGGRPILHELAWANGTAPTTPILTTPETLPELVLVQSWNLKTSNSATSNVAEGIAYVASSNENLEIFPPTLLVAGDEYDGEEGSSTKNRGAIYYYDLPPAIPVLPNTTTPTTSIINPDDLTTLDKTGRLNANLINANLKDSHIGELHVFENVLYVLNDHARVIRAWDRSNGALLATTILPRVGEGLDENWAGLAIERPAAYTPAPADDVAAGNNNNNLRGTPGSPLLVHLTLDSPPQVWTFNATQGTNVGSIVFPPCANAF